MTGTRAGGLKTAQKNIAKNPDFYHQIGGIGGKNGNTGGFASEIVGRDGLTGPQRASKVGSIGGTISRRNEKIKKENL